MMSVPGTQQVVKALQKFKTVVVVDTHLSETAVMALHAIPGSNYLERYDLNATGSPGPCWPETAGDRRRRLPEYETVMAIGRRLGLTDASGKGFFEVGPLSGKPIVERRSGTRTICRTRSPRVRR